MPSSAETAYRIEINNLQDLVEVDESFLREVTCRTLAEEEVPQAAISIALVDNGTIQDLNRRYLGRDEVTDVLSFLLECQQTSPAPKPSSGRPRGSGKRLEGEVILSAQTAVERAAEFSWTPRDEIVLYLVHGLLHLTGYDDLSRSERELMRSREQAILAHWNLTPRYAEVPQGGFAPRDRQASFADGHPPKGGSPHPVADATRLAGPQAQAPHGVDHDAPIPDARTFRDRASGPAESRIVLKPPEHSNAGRVEPPDQNEPPVRWVDS